MEIVQQTLTIVKSERTLTLHASVNKQSHTVAYKFGEEGGTVADWVAACLECAVHVQANESVINADGDSDCFLR